MKMIETESEFSFRKWGWITLSTLFFITGVTSIIARVSYILKPDHHGIPHIDGQIVEGHFLIKVFEKQAMYLGCGYIGMGLLLFGHCYLPYSDRFYRWETLASLTGLILAVLGIGIAYVQLFFPSFM